MRWVAVAHVVLIGGCYRTPLPPPMRSAEPVTAPAKSTATTAEARTTGDVPKTAPPPQVAPILAAIDPGRLHGTVKALAGFGTRHTLSETKSDKRGIGAARRYLKRTLEEIAGDRTRVQVVFDRHRYGPDKRRVDREVEVVNVVATIAGTMDAARDRHIYVLGHYDSRASDPMDSKGDAPGANDDASGVAVVVELARVLADAPMDATVVLMATAGEEQGLLGAKLHAEAARKAGRRIDAVLNNDIVGDPTGPGGRRHDRQIRVFSPALPATVEAKAHARLQRLSATHDGSARQLARYVDTVARWHDTAVKPLIVLRQDRFLRGGDHTAFFRAGFAGVRFCEIRENYDRQHQDPRTEGGKAFGDLPQNVDPDYLASVARLNAAVVIHLANAPAAPSNARIVVADLADDTTIRWSRGSEPDLAGYEVVRRATTSFVWESARDVGDATEATVPYSKDNWFFGVRAYDRSGYRSPVAFPTAADK